MLAQATEGRSAEHRRERQAQAGPPSLLTAPLRLWVLGSWAGSRSLMPKKVRVPEAMGQAAAGASLAAERLARSHVPAAVTGTSNEVRANAVRGCDHNGSCVPDLGYHLSPPFHQWERLVSGVLAHVGARGQAPGPDSQLVCGKPSRAPAFLGRRQCCHVGLHTLSRRFPPPTNS